MIAISLELTMDNLSDLTFVTNEPQEYPLNLFKAIIRVAVSLTENYEN